MSVGNLREVEGLGHKALRVEILPVGIPPKAVLDLRAQVFRQGRAEDLDGQDALCQHLQVCQGGAVLATCRLRLFPAKAPLAGSYSARFYDLAGLDVPTGPSLEIGRFCLSPMAQNPDILRLAWGGIARSLLANKVGFLLGCSSFHGADPSRHLAALSKLARDHLAPQPLWPKAGLERFDLAGLRDRPFDAQAAQAGLPPLLRSYLSMGAWVSHAAVLDRDLDTLHVFTGLDLARVPPSRLRLLQALAEAQI